MPVYAELTDRQLKSANFSRRCAAVTMKNVSKTFWREAWPVKKYCAPPPPPTYYRRQSTFPQSSAFLGTFCQIFFRVPNIWSKVGQDNGSLPNWKFVNWLNRETCVGRTFSESMGLSNWGSRPDNSQRQRGLDNGRAASEIVHRLSVSKMKGAAFSSFRSTGEIFLQYMDEIPPFGRLRRAKS